MPRYNRNQLRAMARQALEARKNNDMRYVDLSVRMQYYTGLSHEQIESKIKEWAEDE